MSTLEHTTMSEFGKISLRRRITEMMNNSEAELSIRSLALKGGINREHLRLFLAGERPATPSMLEKIAQGLGVTVERLRQLDTFKKEQELSILLKANKRTKIMMIRAFEIATELVVVAKGQTEYGYALNNLGRVQYFQQQYEYAHETWLRALEFAKTVQHQFEESQLLHLVSVNLMLTYTLRREYSNIDQFLTIVEDVFADDPDKLGMAQYTRMKVQEERGNLELAKVHAYLSLEKFQQTDSMEQIGKAMVNTAHYEYLLGDYEKSLSILVETITKVKSYDYILVHAIKEYARTLVQLRDYESLNRVVDEYEYMAKGFPDYWGKLKIMYTTATDDSAHAEEVINNSSISLNVRYLACKCLMEFYYLKRDAESAMRYYEKSRIYSNTKCEYINEGGF